MVRKQSHTEKWKSNTVSPCSSWFSTSFKMTEPCLLMRWWILTELCQYKNGDRVTNYELERIWMEQMWPNHSTILALAWRKWRKIWKPSVKIKGAPAEIKLGTSWIQVKSITAIFTCLMKNTCSKYKWCFYEFFKTKSEILLLSVSWWDKSGFNFIISRWLSKHYYHITMFRMPLLRFRVILT